MKWNKVGAGWRQPALPFTNDFSNEPADTCRFFFLCRYFREQIRQGFMNNTDGQPQLTGNRPNIRSSADYNQYYTPLSQY
jgi:hypothetical protein